MMYLPVTQACIPCPPLQLMHVILSLAVACIFHALTASLHDADIQSACHCLVNIAATDIAVASASAESDTLHTS